MRSSFGLLLLVLLLGVSGSPAAVAQTFSEATDVVVVEVPVQVLDGDGKPVRGLTSENFEVYERGRKQKIVGFEVLDLKVDVPTDGTKPRQAAAPPISARRHFLLLFDLSFTSPTSATKAKEAARGILEKLHPSDLVAVGSYISTKGAELLLAFSGDRDQALAAIDRVAKPTALDYQRDPLRLVLGSGAPGTSNEGAAGGEAEGRGTAREAVRATLQAAEADFDQFMEISMERSAREHQERSVTAMTRSLGELARMMQGVRGRKHVLLFSEGFDGALLRGTANLDEQLSMASSSMAGEYWNIDSEKRYGSTKSASVVEDMLEEFRRADCVIQAVDTGGLREGARAEDQWSGGKDSLFLMAKETGGELYENYNDLDVALADMLERNSITYVLAFQPERIERDGAYHRLKVELKGPKRGMRLVHRPGYYSPRHFAERGKLDRTLTTGARLLSGDEPGSVPTSVLATPFPKEGGTAYVPVLIEADGPALLAGNGPGELLAEIYIYALDENGGVRDYLAQALVLELAKVETELRQGGLRFLGHLELPPGRFSLRVLALNGRTGAYGLRTARVEIPEMGAGQPVLLPPLFPQPPGHGVITRQASSGGEEVPFPFAQGNIGNIGDIAWLPDPQPELRQGQETAVALVSYHLAGDLKIRTQVTTPDGREVASGGLRVLGRESGAGDGAQRLRAAFLPPPLAPGEYLLRVTVSGEGGERTSSAPFVVN